MDYTQMTISQLEAVIIEKENAVKSLRAEQRAAHDAAEAARQALPIVGGLGQIIKPGSDWQAFFKQFPADAIEAFKAFVKGDK